MTDILAFIITIGVCLAFVKLCEKPFCDAYSRFIGEEINE